MERTADKRIAADLGRMDEDALEGLRVIDMATFIAAPFAATMLADFGAEVIKVEMPGTGDPLRNYGPKHKGVPYWWTQDDRNKKGLTVDLRKADGQEIIKRLVAVSDVVIENFRPGTLESWNLGYDELSQINPRIILARVTGYGQTGRYRKRAAFASMGGATGGLRHLTGYPDGPPVFPGVALEDYLTSLFTALGVMIAVYHRDRRGGGQVIDSSLCESVFRLLEYTPLQHAAEGYIPCRQGPEGPRAGAASPPYLSKDGKYVYISPATDRLFSQLAHAMGQPELIDDPRFASVAGRQQSRLALWEIIKKWVGQHSHDEVEASLDQHGVPVGTVYDIRDIFQDPYFTERGDLVDLQHPILGLVKTQAPTPKLSHTPGRVRHWAPELGQHNQEILGDLLGYSQEEMAKLKAAEVI